MTDAHSWRDFDWPLLIGAVLIASLGVIEVFSATRNTPGQEAHLRQILWILMGVVLMWAVSSVDYHWLVSQTPAFYAATVVGLLGVLMFGPVINGARRWLPIPGLTICKCLSSPK